MDLADPEIEPATGLFFAAAVVRIIPVVFEHVPYVALPLGVFNSRTTPPVIGGKVVVVPDRVDRHFLGKLRPLRLALPAVVMKKLHLRSLRVIDVDIVAQQKKGPRIDRPDGVPNAFVHRDIASSSAEGDSERVSRRILLQGSVRKGTLPGPGLGVELPGVRLAMGKV